MAPIKKERDIKISSKNISPYVYFLFDWRGVPFYVGKGVGNRDSEHERKSDPINWLKTEIIAQTFEMLEELPKTRIYYHSHTAAFAAEIAFISALGRIDLGTGPLVNMTAGGEGFDSETAQKTHAARTPEQRSEIMRKANAARTPEQRSEARRKVHAAKTSEQRSEIARKAQAARTPKQRSEIARERWAAMTPERRSEIARKANAARTLKQHREAGRKRWAALPPEQRSEIARKVHAARTPEQRSETARKANGARTPEQRSEIARKAATAPRQLPRAALVLR